MATLSLGACSSDPISTPLPHTVLVRKNVRQLTATEVADLVAAIKKLKEVPSPYRPELSYYDQFVMWHRNAFYCDTNAAHMGPAFLPWHRQFLLMFEHALTSVSGKQITLPYWDWTDEAGRQRIFSDDLLGGDGDPSQGHAVTTGPFKKGAWELKVFDQNASDSLHIPWLVRGFGQFPGISLPTKAQIDSAIALPAYDAAPWNATVPAVAGFRNYIEGWRGNTGEDCEDSLMTPLHHHGNAHVMHNAVHLWIAGMFGDTAGTIALNTSPNDPVFWFIHANLDRLWEEWLDQHGQTYVPVTGGPSGHNLNDAMWPYRTIGLTVTPAMMLDEKKLGYAYDTESP